MHKILSILSLTLAVCLASVSTPAAAGGHVNKVQEANLPVPRADHQALTDYNVCVSREYSALPSPRPANINNAMGRFRDNVTEANRAVTANNKAVFDTASRSAQVNGAEAVGSRCTFVSPAVR